MTTRCRDCRWVHEADSVAGTGYMGVELCPLHENMAGQVAREKIINAELVIERDCLTTHRDRLKKLLELALKRDLTTDERGECLAAIAIPEGKI